MSDRALKSALIVSLLVNAFLAAAVAAGSIYLFNAMSERATQRRHTPLGEVASRLDPTVREQLKRSMRAAALAAAPDFREAHAERRAAADLTSAKSFDQAAVAKDLAKALAAEDRGRAKLEAGFVAFSATQPQPVRAELAKVLSGHGSMHVKGESCGGPPPHNGAPSPPPPR